MEYLMISCRSTIAVLLLLAISIGCAKREVRETKYDDGQKKEQFYVKLDAEGNEVKDGPHSSWYENGQKETETPYKNGKPEGRWTGWYENGQKSVERNFKDGKEDGMNTWWYENGQKKREQTCKDGKLVSNIEWDEKGQKKEPSAEQAHPQSTEPQTQTTYGDMTYAGLKFGLSKEQVYATFRNAGVAANGDEDNDGEIIRIQFNGVLAPVGKAHQTECEFCGGKLFEIVLVWPEKSDFDDCLVSFNEVRSILAKKYGNPNGGNSIKPGFYETKWQFDNGKFLMTLSIMTPEANGAHTLVIVYCNKSFDNCSDRNNEAAKGTSGF
jgi:MORN repeat variant